MAPQMQFKRVTSPFAHPKIVLLSLTSQSMVQMSASDGPAWRNGEVVPHSHPTCLSLPLTHPPTQGHPVQLDHDSLNTCPCAASIWSSPMVWTSEACLLELGEDSLIANHNNAGLPWWIHTQQLCRSAQGPDPVQTPSLGWPIRREVTAGSP